MKIKRRRMTPCCAFWLSRTRAAASGSMPSARPPSIAPGSANLLLINCLRRGAFHLICSSRRSACIDESRQEVGARGQENDTPPRPLRAPPRLFLLIRSRSLFLIRSAAPCFAVRTRSYIPRFLFSNKKRDSSFRLMDMFSPLVAHFRGRAYSSMACLFGLPFVLLQVDSSLGPEKFSVQIYQIFMQLSFFHQFFPIFFPSLLVVLGKANCSSRFPSMRYYDYAFTLSCSVFLLFPSASHN